jgi:hypothetical protein
MPPADGYPSLLPREKLQSEADLPTPTPVPAPVGFSTPELMRHMPSSWLEVWGFGGFEGTYGNRMAPNGVPFEPIFDAQAQLNFGLLPEKKLYLFADMDFWGQAPGAAVTNPLQGSFDFSKREWDFNVGVAWNYWGSMEFRFLGYALNNLNRGTSQISPYGYNDGLGIENRYYFAYADKYDVGKLSFLSLGYLAPSSTLTGQDGMMFHGGLTARAYLTCDIPMLRSYLYFDGKYYADSSFLARLLEYDLGVAVRPFEALQNLEFRVGGAGTYDVQYHYDRSFGYIGVRLQF